MRPYALPTHRVMAIRAPRLPEVAMRMEPMGHRWVFPRVPSKSAWISLLAGDEPQNLAAEADAGGEDHLSPLAS